MRGSRMVVVAAILLVVLAATASFALAATKTVGVKKKGSHFLWNPPVLRIKKGDTVKWSWTGNVPHNVTGPGFHSKTANKLTYSRKFTRAGTYRVVCTIHKSLGQRMVIRVS